MDETVDDVWHVFSDGTKADIPFDTDEDKVYGWNSVAICAEIAGVKVWVVTVNDTHFHSLVKGSAERAERYRCVLQQRLQRHFFKGRKVSDLSSFEEVTLFGEIKMPASPRVFSRELLVEIHTVPIGIHEAGQHFFPNHYRLARNMDVVIREIPLQALLEEDSVAFRLLFRPFHQ